MKPDSSSISSVVYDSKSKELTITFTSGEIHVYYGVPENLYQNLLDAESKLEYFNKHIRDRWHKIIR